MHDLGQSFGRGRSGVHGLDPVVVGLGEEGVGGVHQKTLALAFAAAMAVSPKLLRVEKTCVWFAVMIIFAKFRAFSQHRRRLPCLNILEGLLAHFVLQNKTQA